MRRVVVPLVVFGLAVMLWMWRTSSETPVVDMTTDVAECAANLGQIYRGLILYGISNKHPPTESGVRFLAAIYGKLENTPQMRAALTCPGPNAEPVREDVDYGEPATLTSADSAYAARDMANFALAKFPSGGNELEPIAACDNEHGLNHDGCMNVLYSDGSVVTLFLDEEIERGNLPAGSKTIPVGKDSPIPDLRKLTRD